MHGFLMHRSCSLKMKIRQCIVPLLVAQRRGTGSLDGSKANGYPAKTQQVQGINSETSGESYSKLLKLPMGGSISNALCYSACHLSILSCYDLSLKLCPFTRAPDT